MSKLIKSWYELSQVPSNGKYKIEVNEIGGAWIKPIIETKKTENKYFKTHYYLSTHTFYGSYYKKATEILQKFGFDLEIDNWDKEK